MTDHVHPSFGRTGNARAREIAAALSMGGYGEGVVWPSTSRLVEDSEGLQTVGALGAFAHTTTTGLDVTLDDGEAVVGGAYIARDTTTVTTLPASTTTTLSLGWKDGQADTILIGEVGSAVGDAFTADDPRMPVYEFTTDGSTVTATTDLRTVVWGAVGEQYDALQTGIVGAGDTAVLDSLTLPAGATLYVTAISYRQVDGTAVPTGVDFEIGTLSGGSYTQQTVLASGDGATTWSREHGNPVGSYTNGGGSAVTAALAVDNTTQASYDTLAYYEGYIVT